MGLVFETSVTRRNGAARTAVARAGSTIAMNDLVCASVKLFFLEVVIYFKRHVRMLNNLIESEYNLVGNLK